MLAINRAENTSDFVLFSVLAPTSTSYFGQHMILSHMNSHYKRITSAKAAVDTSAPRSMKQHIRVQDQKRRLYLNERDSEGSLSPGRRSQHSRGINDDTSIQREQEFGTQTMLSPREDFVNGVQTGITSGRSSRMEYPGLSSSFGSSRMSSAYARKKKDIQTKMWEEEQMYMEFISEVTSDVLARGIFTN
ncbi:hypothetical protein QZH41_014040, partial [Actinostola sp. cb2023]